MSGEECTSGVCWDCQGTGHPHLGRCRSRFLDWWHVHESIVTLVAMLWTIATTVLFLALLPRDAYAWACWVSLGPTIAVIPAWMILGTASDRQIQKHGLPPAKQVSR